LVFREKEKQMNSEVIDIPDPNFIINGFVVSVIVAAGVIILLLSIVSLINILKENKIYREKRGE